MRTTLLIPTASPAVVGIVEQVDQVAVVGITILVEHGLGIVLTHLDLKDVLQTPSSGVLLDLIKVDEMLGASNAGDAVGAAGGVADGLDLDC